MTRHVVAVKVGVWCLEAEYRDTGTQLVRITLDGPDVEALSRATLQGWESRECTRYPFAARCFRDQLIEDPLQLVVSSENVIVDEGEDLVGSITFST
ncbi:hypothetical protein D3C84_1002600 [compost metagenome]